MTCYSGKIGYASKKDAQTDMRIINAAGRRSRAYVKAKKSYQCPHCGEWHLTSQKNFKSGKLHKPYKTGK